MSSALVFIMLPGLAFFYAGLVRSKNVIGTMAHSFVALAVVGLVWILWGYSLAFGPDLGGFIGNLTWFGLNNVSAFEAGPYSDSIPHMAFMIFQAKFAIITPALIAGAFAERIKFGTFVIFLVLWSTIVYSPLAHWIWGGGWLGDWGGLDFAGGAVVHISSGVAALCAALMFGRRQGYGQDDMSPHNVPYVIFGAALLWFGWFGFNAGSALSASGTAASAFVVTHTAAAMAAVVWAGLDYFFTGRVSVVGLATGAVAGLATITPAAGFVGPMPALIIGLAAGAICYGAVRFKTRMQFDDSLDVWAIHGVGGTIGMLAVGLFFGLGMGLDDVNSALGSDLSYWGQIGRQLGTIGVAWAWSFVATMAILIVLQRTIGLRVSIEDEKAGLDTSQHGDTAYERA